MDTSMWTKQGLAAMLAIMRSVGVTQEMILRNPLHTGKGARTELVHPGFETQGRRHQNVQNRGISVRTKRNDVLQKFLKKDINRSAPLLPPG